MAELTVHDPAGVRAVAIGLERYPEAPPDWTQAGAATDALRFGRWLRGCGVPASNISMLLSPEEDSVRLLDDPDLRLDLTWSNASSRDQIMNALTRDVDRWSGHTLYVYWGGHGVMGSDDRRLLLLPDAMTDDKRCIDAIDLCSYLTRANLRGFERQILLFDACATFIEYHHEHNEPKPTPFPPRSRAGGRRFDQFILNAADVGQVAENNRELRTGVFSKEVLDWLEANPDGLGFDQPTLRAHLDALFDGVGVDGVERQTPVSFEIRSKGSLKRVLALPQLAAIDRTAQTEVALALHVEIPDHPRREFYVEYVTSECFGAQTDPSCSLQKFAQVLLSTPRAMAALVEAMRAEAPEAADHFASLGRSHRAPGLLSPLEHRRLHEALSAWPEVPLSQLTAILRQTLPLYRGSWQRELSTEAADGSLQRLMTCVEHLEAHVGGQSLARPGEFLVPAVVRFTEYLAATVSDPARTALLEQWGDRVAHRLGVGAGGLTERREDARRWALSARGPDRPPRVVVQIDPDQSAISHGGPTFSCALWIDVGTGPLVRVSHEPHSGPFVPQRIVRFVQKAAADLGAVGGAEPRVEILLSDDDLFLPVDTWDGADAAAAVPMLLGVDRAIAIRCRPLGSAERERERQAQLRARWCDHEGRTIFLDEKHVAGYAAYGALKEDPAATRVVVCTGSPAREQLVRTAVFLGYPVVLWDREALSPVPETRFAPLTAEADVYQLPERARSYRARALNAPDEYTMRPALLWEKPAWPLPPVLSLTELSDPGHGGD